MASASKRSKTETDMEGASEMDPNTARKLFEEGAILVFLNVPEGTEFGMDYNSWTVGSKFRGVKMIPPGIHFVYYSAVSKLQETAPRSGFFYNFKQREILVKKWDPRQEDISDYSPTDDEMHRYECNREEMDRYLGPYPYESLKRWVSLTNRITEPLMKALVPNSGKITSATELLCDKESRTTQQRAEIHASVADDASMEDKLPQMHTNPDTQIHFSEIPKKYPSGANPAEITKYSMDSSYALETLVKTHYNDNVFGVIGELQFAFICFLLGQVYDSFEHWKHLFHLLCSCEDAIDKHGDLYHAFMTTIYFQLAEIPKDFFVDIVTRNNFLTSCLADFFRNLDDSEATHHLKSRGRKLKQSLTKKFQWDFDDFESGEYAPTVVDLS
ncbi:protein AAR2 homolog [Ptychodera flava]|uniref:protein AAR2 homolog n=1 Tax=Ptychodera flava TaxID=63121 RepID=UPI003969E559